MRIAVKQMMDDIRGLLAEVPEVHTYAILLEASLPIMEMAQGGKGPVYEAYEIQAHDFLESLEKGDPHRLQKRFFLLVQRPWVALNRSLAGVEPEQAKTIIDTATKEFWGRVKAEANAAEDHLEGRRYGAFWIPFLIGAAAIGSIGVYAASKETKEYAEEKKQEIAPWLYVGAGALGAFLLAKLMR